MSYTVRARGRRFQAHASAKVAGVLQQQRRSGFVTYEQAELWARRREAEMAGGDVPKDAGIETWGELCQWAWDTHYVRARSKAAKSILEQARDMIGPGTKLLTVSRATLRSYVERLRADHNTEATIKRKLSVVAKILRDASREGWIPELPEAPTVTPRRGGRLRWLTDAELAQLLDLLRSDGRQEYCDLVEFLADTGLRLGEALALRWSAVTPDSVTVWLNKSDRPRTVPLTTRAKLVLDRRRDLGWGPFKTLSVDTFHRAWNVAKGAMGLAEDREFVPHSLRHTFASKLVQSGARLQEVQQLLGHASMQQTLVYAHLAPANLAQAIALLEPAATFPPA